MLTAWLQESEPPRTRYESRAGRWITEPTWPSTAVTASVLHLADARLAGESAPVERSICSPADTGLASGEWCPYGAGDELPPDQGADDDRSLVFDGDSLDQPLQLLGGARLALELSVDVADGQIAARLLDVASDGTSARVRNDIFRGARRRHRHDRQRGVGSPASASSRHRWSAPAPPGQRSAVLRGKTYSR